MLVVVVAVVNQEEPKSQSRYLRDDKGDQTDFDKVGQTVFTRADDSLDEGNNGDKDEDANKNIADLLPDALQERDLLLLRELIGSVLFEAGGRFGRRQTAASNVAVDAEHAADVFFTHGVPLGLVGLGNATLFGVGVVFSLLRRHVAWFVAWSEVRNDAVFGSSQ